MPIQGDPGQKHLPPEVKCALIDMDGVLYDSMPYHAKAWHDMFAEMGIELPMEEFFLYEGMTGGDTIQMLIKRELGRDATEEEKKGLYDKKAVIFVGHGEKKKMPGASEMLETIKKLGLKTILVTGSAQGSLLESLDKDYPGFFPKERRVTALDVTKGKPDPEPYIMGRKKAGVKPEEAIVVENAPLGVRAGKASGSFTIAVTTGPIPRKEFEKEGADLIFSSMHEFAQWLKKEYRIRELATRLDEEVKKLNPDTVVLVTDSNVEKDVMPMLEISETVKNSLRVVIHPGEAHKSIRSVEEIWKGLEKAGATRNSLVVNIGGGLITDIGGFAAATFKRGINYINLPTTLLGAVDAATGGKTGINFQGLKNEIGSFHSPQAVIISSIPLDTLHREEIFSGYAEMLKTGFIADEYLYKTLKDPEKVVSDPELLEKCMKDCVRIKEEVVEADPKEKGLRKILNFGHTAGHAFESLAFRRGFPLAHGEAVAHGMLVELILSHMLKGLDSKVLHDYSLLLKENYPRIPVSCDDIEELIEIMAHDKKNPKVGKANFTLLHSVGNPEINCYPEKTDIGSALEIYLDMMG